MLTRRMRSLVFAPLVLVSAGCSGEDDGSSSVEPAGSTQAGQGGASAQAGAAGKAGASGAGAQGGSSGKGGAGGHGGGAGASAQGGAGQAGAAGKSGAAGAAGGCATSADCTAVPTVPPGCAEAKCEAGKCVQYARDADKDTFAASKCKAVDGVTPIVLGEDCDDTNPDVNPKGWDGPAGEGHPNHCNDGLDQDCSGMIDDGKLKDGTTCTCSPGDTQNCSQDASGKPIAYPGGKPQGACAYGHQTCLPNGIWGPCVDAVSPSQEVCDAASKIDEDCDGLVDDKDPDVMGQKSFYCDADSDSFLAPDAKPVISCQQPPKEQCSGDWTTSGQKTDCDDKDVKTFPMAVELCDGKDNNCDDQVDNGVGVSSDSCTVGQGVCQVTQNKECVGGSYQCTASPGTAGTEVCNGKDDDCDGVVDNNLPASPCTVDTCPGALPCVNGSLGGCQASNKPCPPGWAFDPVPANCTVPNWSDSTGWDQYAGGDNVNKGKTISFPDPASTSGPVSFDGTFSQNGTGCYTSGNNNELHCLSGSGAILQAIGVNSGDFNAKATKPFTCPAGTKSVQMYKLVGGSSIFGCMRFMTIANVRIGPDCKY